MWPQVTLQALMRAPIQYGIVQTGVPVEGGVPCVRVMDLSTEPVCADRIVRVDPSIHTRYRKTCLEGKDLLFVLRGDIGIVREVPAELIGANIHRGVARLSPNLALVDHRYVLHALQARDATKEMHERATGSALRELPINQLRRLPVPVPPLAIQRNIASVLDLLAERVAMTRAVLDATRCRKRGLMQRLFSQSHVVLSASAVATRQLPLSAVLTESRTHASTGQHARKLTIKLYGKGLVAKRDTRPGSAHTQYYRRSAGQFIYSKLDFLNGAFGIVPSELDGYESTLDLPAFDVSDSVNPRWLLQLFSWPGFYKRHVDLANGGRKARRVNPAQLLRLEITFPPRDTQDQIADLLLALDEEIELLGKLASALDRHKQALLEMLLSGKIEVHAT